MRKWLDGVLEQVALQARIDDAKAKYDAMSAFIRCMWRLQLPVHKH